MDAKDPDAPGKAMCLDPELPKAATSAGVDASVACKVCPLRNQCGYQRQRDQRADIWLGAHNLAFQRKPRGLPKAAVVVMDEAFWPAAVKGQDGAQPIQLALSALRDDRTGSVAGLSRQRLLDLRGRVHRALEGHEAGLLMRAALVAADMTAESAAEWHALEWATKPLLKMEGDGWTRDSILDAVTEAGSQAGFSKLRAAFAGYVRDLLASDAARSVNVTFEPTADLGRNQGSGPALRFAWREDFAEWSAGAPKLFLDATTHPDVLRAWSPGLDVVDIEISAPHQHVRQVIDRQFGRTFFMSNAGNVQRIADLALTELAAAAGEDVLLIAQAAVEDLLRTELERRAGTAGIVPDPDNPHDFIASSGARLHLAHHGALTGMDRWRRVGAVVVVGRPAMNRSAGERLAEIIYGRPLGLVQDGDENRWPIAPGGVRMTTGKGVRVEAPRHPDALVEGLRWSITEGAIMQAIGRARGVQRTDPVRVTLLTNLPLPLSVETVAGWAEIQPDRLTTAAAEAALAGVACPFAPADMVKARPDLWESEKAAENDKQRSIVTGASHPLVDPATNALRGFGCLSPARYRRGQGGGRWSFALVPMTKGRELLEAITGPLAAFETLAAAPAHSQRPHAAETPMQAAQEPQEVPTAAPRPTAAEAPETAPTPRPASARVYSMGEAPPFDLPAAPAAPPPAAAAPPRAVPNTPPPSARKALADLSLRLDRLRPPRLWGDPTDALRIAAWRQRQAEAARIAEAARADRAAGSAFGAA
jgi:hypothetical protein